MIGANAQTVLQNESALIYAMPKTVLMFDVEIERVEQKVGKFFLYSQRYLQTSDVIMENKTSYVLKSVTMRTKTVADEQRKFKLSPNLKSATTYITINKEGILAGVNYDVPTPVATPEITAKKGTKKKQKNDLPLFNEEQILANSISKMAAITAKQIYRIRDSRTNWITGDMDNMPADGASVKTILAELDKTERALCELFVGSTSRESIVQTIEYTPTSSVENHVLFRISNVKGIIPSDDLSGSPVFLHIQAQQPSVAEENQKRKKKSETPAFFYNLPGTASIKITQGSDVFYYSTNTIPQFGVNLTLPQSLFTKNSTKVLFDTETGIILDIKKGEEL